MKLEFILEDLTLDDNPTDDALNEFLTQNPDRFRQYPEFHSSRFTSARTIVHRSRRMPSVFSRS